MSLKGEPHRVGHLRDGVVERLPHRLRHRRGVFVLDASPRVECPHQEAPARSILQRDGEADVGLVRWREHLVERQHIDVERDRLRIIRQPQARRLTETSPERLFHVVCG